MTVYLDASIMAAVLLREPATTTAKALLGPDIDMTLSTWSLAETTSVFARRLRNNEITEARRLKAEAALDIWAERVRLDRVTDRDIVSARRLVSTSPSALKAPDALHLAIVMRIGAELATLDGGLAKAARAFGVPVRT